MKNEAQNDHSTNPEPHLAGVCPAHKKDGTLYFRASLTYRRKHISLGGFDSPEQAHHAYLEGSLLLADPSVSLVQYRPSSHLPFEKWVSLINFRDNGIYLGTPIYVGQKMFQYYLSPTHILKFDMDDLFFYSSHKIMCRGRHYFVADYGMQTNIVTRYGIKNYAVEGRDYRFINGDRTDFRRENLRIMNIYHGVTSTYQNGQYVYTVRIHVKGYYLVGRYLSEAEAAIAYNKAADTLIRNGLKKNYSLNYVDGISPSKYADIYTNLEIAPKIRNYRPDHFSE